MTKTKLTEEQAKAILDLPMDPDRNDAKASSVRGYLKTLLRNLMRDGEGFSGKRPFGNSGWQSEIHMPLIKAKLVRGKFDEDGYIEDYNDAKAEKLILEAIEWL